MASLVIKELTLLKGQNRLHGYINLFVWPILTKTEFLLLHLPKKHFCLLDWVEKVFVSDVDCTAEEFYETLLSAFPKFWSGGGFELLRCLPST